MVQMNDILRSAAFLFVPLLVFGEVIEVDVGAWADVGTGTTPDGWKVNGIGRYADGGAKFAKASDSVLSPPYADFVTQIVMSVKSSSPTVAKKLMITPTTPEDATAHEAIPTASSEKYTVETFSWSVSNGVRQFRLQEGSGSSGTWGVKSLAVYTDRIEPPTGLREDALYRDAFAAAWNSASKAVRYQIQYGSVTRIPPSYETVVEWNFSSLTNTSGNAKGFEDLRKEFPNVLDGVTGMNLGLQGNDGGHLQIGRSDVAGAMELQLDAAVSSRICFITNWRHDKDPSSGCSAFCLAGDGSTNEVISLTAGASPATDMFALPDGTCTLRVESLKSRRVEILSVIVATDYDPGSVTTNEFKTIGTRATAKVVKDLTPGEWVWAVRSFDAEGHDSPWSPFRTVVLDREMPRYPRPGFSISIR